MKISSVGTTAAVALVVISLAFPAFAQKERDIPTASLNFLVVKDYNGKPIRNAAVVMHPVDEKGQQERGGMELKTDLDGKSSYDGIPYGKLRVQVLAQGFQTYGEDFDINQPKMSFTIKLKRPQAQYSIYGTDSSQSGDQEKKNAGSDKKPN